MQTIHLPSLSKIADNYDAFILDLWGVIHDGLNLYPGALEALEQLKALNKRVIFLSNAPRRAAASIARLNDLGVDSSLYERVITSGEIAFSYLSQPQNQEKWNRNCYYLGLEADKKLLDGLDYYKQTQIIENTYFILNAGFERFHQPMEEIIPLLNSFMKKNTPMLCVNPDIEVVRQNGERILCAGYIARCYEEMGGSVTYIGKPYEIVYESCIEHFSAMNKEKILAVGDGPITDIKGANGVGIDCALVTGGILRHIKHSDNAKTEIEQTCRKYEIVPQYVVPEFAW